MHWPCLGEFLAPAFEMLFQSPSCQDQRGVDRWPWAVCNTRWTCDLSASLPFFPTWNATFYPPLFECLSFSFENAAILLRRLSDENQDWNLTLRQNFFGHHQGGSKEVLEPDGIYAMHGDNFFFSFFGYKENKTTAQFEHQRKWQQLLYPLLCFQFLIDQH